MSSSQNGDSGPQSVLLSGNGGIRSAEMSLYDKNRVPQPAINDNTEITICPRSLNSELTCPICLDMLKNTMTTKECLHRFCLECITTALRSGNKECPTCRKKLVSKRSLRPDPNFDALISKIYPNREEYEASQQKAFARLSKHSNGEAFQKWMEEGVKHQAQLRKRLKLNPQDFEYKKRSRKRKETSTEGAASDRESSAEPSVSEASGEPMVPHQQEMELILRPHPQMEALPNSPIHQTRYLKTTANATVDHISKYLSMRVRLDSEEASRLETGESARVEDLPELGIYVILVNPGIGSNKQYTEVDGSWTLADVRNRFWKVKRPLELQFKVEARPQHPPSDPNAPKIMENNFSKMNTSCP